MTYYTVPIYWGVVFGTGGVESDETNQLRIILMGEFSTLLQQGNAWFFIPSAILLGVLHGLEPGHSKTMMAAFIIAIKGTIKQAVMLGLAATLSHTAVVWLIALGGMYISKAFTARRSNHGYSLSRRLLFSAPHCGCSGAPGAGSRTGWPTRITTTGTIITITITMITTMSMTMTTIIMLTTTIIITMIITTNTIMPRWQALLKIQKSIRMPTNGRMPRISSAALRVKRLPTGKFCCLA